MVREGGGRDVVEVMWVGVIMRLVMVMMVSE